VCAKKCATHAEHAEQIASPCRACDDKMSTHAEHAVKSYNFSNFLKQVKTQIVKSLKNRFANLQMGSKATTRNFIFELDLN
jgi:hypothetical protein